MAKNANLHAANKAKKDEFYIQMVDIVIEENCQMLCKECNRRKSSK